MFFERIRKMEPSVKAVGFHAVIISCMLIAGFTARSVKSEDSGYHQIAYQTAIDDFTKMDPDYMIRAIRSIGREKLFEILRNIDPHTLSRLIRQMDSEKVARLIHGIVDDPSFSSPQSFRSDRFSPVPMRFRGMESIQDQDTVVSGGSNPGISAFFGDRDFSIIIHPSNPVTALTQSELRSVFSGHIKNWSQLGGPDMPVEVMFSSGRTSGSLPGECACFQIFITPFSGVVIAGVAETKGALGLVIARDRMQKVFLDSHEAIKRIALKN